MIDIKAATIEELRKQFYMMINAGTLTDEQSNLLDKIVDEINEREGRNYTKENLNILYSYYLGKYNLTDNVLPENAGAIDFILAILESCSGDEFIRLREILSEQVNSQGESKEAISGTDDPLYSRDAEPPQVKPKPRRRFRHIRRLVVILAALFLIGTIAALASRFNLFSLTRWTKETVEFGIPANEQPVDAEYSRLIFTLDVVGIQIDLPRYLPDGFSLDTIEPDESAEFSPIVAWFVRGDDEFHIRVKKIDLDLSNNFSQKNDEEREFFKEIYAITSNMHRMAAIWYQDGYELSIHGDLSREELLKILDSI